MIAQALDPSLSATTLLPEQAKPSQSIRRMVLQTIQWAAKVPGTIIGAEAVIRVGVRRRDRRRPRNPSQARPPRSHHRQSAGTPSLNICGK